MLDNTKELRKNQTTEPCDTNNATSSPFQPTNMSSIHYAENVDVTIVAANQYSETMETWMQPPTGNMTG